MEILLIILLVAAITALVIALFNLKDYRKKSAKLKVDLDNQRLTYDQELAKLQAYSNKLKVENQVLSKWRGVADADAKARELLAAASQTLEKARSESQTLVAEAQEQAAALLARAREEASSATSEAKQKAKRTTEQAGVVLDSATARAATIIESARKRAEEIAGSAYDALNNADLYERTVKAMKNIIDGYGDQYLIPTHSLLDDLAEEFGHTQAGVELKSSRERSIQMARNGTAAACDYVEAYRQKTAINFVVDAFNGKVDSILSRVKNDNVGTLQQEIRDAFTLVNYNGKAFRDARIREEYLSARLDELKWAAIAQQLKLDEREEQRKIKEQMREEEKARREYERAIREAAREEEMLRKAMVKAQQQIEQATEEQKAKYEQQLIELEQRLKEAEERNQRALSMAQITRRGHVYIISNIGSFGEDIFKIGLTRRLEPLDRVRELGDSSVPFEFDVHALIVSDDAPELETRLHKNFLLKQVNKVNRRKEFFGVSLQEIRQEIERMGLDVKWTMVAEAKEYRETLALEKMMKDNPEMQQAWIKRQLLLEQIDHDNDEEGEEAS